MTLDVCVFNDVNKGNVRVFKNGLEDGVQEFC